MMVNYNVMSYDFFFLSNEQKPYPVERTQTNYQPGKNVPLFFHQSAFSSSVTKINVW